MGRVQVPIVAQDLAGTAIAGATIDIVDRETGQPPTVFQDETGGAMRSLPLTTGANGRPPDSYVERGAYEITVQAAAIGTDVFDWDAASASDGSVDYPWLTIQHDVYPVVTALPANPTDGQVCFFLADAANGVVWQLRYRAASSSPHKWEYVGGASLFTDDATTHTAEFGNTFYNSISGAPVSITVPLDGDYELTAGVTAWTSGNEIWTAIRLGSASAADGDGWRAYGGDPDPGGRMIKRGLTALETISLEHRSNTGNINVENRFLAAKPVRVG